MSWKKIRQWFYSVFTGIHYSEHYFPLLKFDCRAKKNHRLYISHTVFLLPLCGMGKIHLYVLYEYVYTYVSVHDYLPVCQCGWKWMCLYHIKDTRSLLRVYRNILWNCSSFSPVIIFTYRYVNRESCPKQRHLFHNSR